MFAAANNVYSQTVDVHVKVTCPGCPKGSPAAVTTPGTFKPGKLVPNDWPRKPRQPYNPPRLNPPPATPVVINNNVPPPTVIIVQSPPVVNTFAAPPAALAAPMAAPPPPAPAPIPANLAGGGCHISTLGWVAISLGAAVVGSAIWYGINEYRDDHRSHTTTVVTTDPDPPHNSQGQNPGDPGTHKPGTTSGGGDNGNNAYRYASPAMSQPSGLVLMRF